MGSEQKFCNFRKWLQSYALGKPLNSCHARALTRGLYKLSPAVASLFHKRVESVCSKQALSPCSLDGLREWRSCPPVLLQRLPCITPLLPHSVFPSLLRAASLLPAPCVRLVFPIVFHSLPDDWHASPAASAAAGAAALKSLRNIKFLGQLYQVSKMRVRACFRVPYSFPNASILAQDVVFSKALHEG